MRMPVFKAKSRTLAGYKHHSCLPLPVKLVLKRDMQSMTGFGRATTTLEPYEVTIELTSVNRKNLEVTCSLPRDWQAMERLITASVRQQLHRGKVSVNLQLSTGRELETLSWDEPLLADTVNELRLLSDRLGLRFDTDAAFLLKLITTLGGTRALPDWESAWATLAPALETAVTALGQMRREEGTCLAEDLRSRLDAYGEWVGEIRQLSEATVPAYKALLLQRLQKAGLEIDTSDERVLKEIALFADRCDITEELTRLASHLEQFRATLDASGSIGRKLDFLCQEINREVNTIGSKANNLEITRLVIDCKNELERIREQVQNIE